MKKLNIQVYQGNPEEMVTRDNNNLFIDGEIEYNAGGGTVVKSITSVKNADGVEIASGGGGGDEFPYGYAIFSGTITINPDDWDHTEDVPHLNMPICDANFESSYISMLAHDGSDIEFSGVPCSQEGGISAYCIAIIDDDQFVTLNFYYSSEDDKIHMTCELDSYITEQINTVTFNNVIFMNYNNF